MQAPRGPPPTTPGSSAPRPGPPMMMAPQMGTGPRPPMMSPPGSAPRPITPGSAPPGSAPLVRLFSNTLEILFSFCHLDYYSNTFKMKARPPPGMPPGMPPTTPGSRLSMTGPPPPRGVPMPPQQAAQMSGKSENANRASMVIYYLFLHNKTVFLLYFHCI